MNTSLECKEHPGAKIAGACIQCKRPVCAKCLQLRGYFCSDACKAEHLASKPAIESEEKRLHREKQAKQGRRADLIAVWLFRRIPLAVLTVLIILVGLYFLDRSGKERWHILPDPSTPYVDLVASDNALFAVRNDGVCISLDPASGKEKWKGQPASVDSSNGDLFSRFTSVFNSRLEAREGLILKGGLSSISILDAATGSSLWQKNPGIFEHLPAILHGGRVLFVDRGRTNEDDARGGAPAGGDGFVFSLNQQSNQRLVCADARSGNETWRRSFENREIRSIDAAGEICFCITCLPPRLEWVRCSAHSATNDRTMLACENCNRRFVKASAYEMNVMKAADGTPLWTGRLASGFIDQVRLYEDRIAVLAGSHLYVLSRSGDKKVHSRLPSDTKNVAMGGDYAVASTRSGRIVVISTRDGRTVWEQSVGGQAWDLDIAADSLYVTAGVPRETTDKAADGTPRSPAPRSAQEQLLVEMKGQYKSYDEEAELRSRPECRTLINYRLTDGRERWRHNAVVGELHVLPDGNCLLLAQGAEATALFLAGTGSFVSEHLQRNGKQAWGFKVQEATFALRADADTVYLLTGEGRGLFGKWSETEVRNGTIRAVQRRTIINRVRKF